MQLLADVQLVPDEPAPLKARQVVREVLPPDVPTSVAHDVLIVVSEMVSYKVLADGLRAGQLIGLRLLGGDVVRIEVDGNDRLRPADAPRDGWAHIGAMVERLSHRSGVDQRDRVLAWADIAL